MNTAFYKGKTSLFSRFVENLVPDYIAKKNLVLYTNVGCAGFRLEVPHAFFNRKGGGRLVRSQRDSAVSKDWNSFKEKSFNPSAIQAFNYCIAKDGEGKEEHKEILL